MRIDPDKFKMDLSKPVKNAMGMRYPDCPIDAICAYVTPEGEPLAEPRCEYFEEPPKGKREPNCLYDIMKATVTIIDKYKEGCGK